MNTAKQDLPAPETAPQCSFAGMPGWATLTASRRNTMVGERMGLKPPFSRLCLKVGGKWVVEARGDETDLEKTSRMIAEAQSTEIGWLKLRCAFAELADEWRGQVTVGVHRWYLRYSDTPGGGWVVIEAIRANGYAVSVESMEAGWLIQIRRAGDPTYSISAPTMAEAACLAALRIPWPNSDLSREGGKQDHG